MEFLNQTFYEHPVYFLLAGISTVVFIFKMGLLTLGLGKEFEFDTGIDGADHYNAGKSFSFISTQTILAFLMGVGWLGLTASEEWSLGPLVTFAVAAAFGAGLMVLTAVIAASVQKLEKVRSFNRWSLIGSSGKVYLTVPPRGQGEGQIEVVIAGSKKIVKALNQGDDEIPSFSDVTVVTVEGQNFVVKRKN